jgi:hypothetical protein
MWADWKFNGGDQGSSLPGHVNLTSEFHLRRKASHSCTHRVEKWLAKVFYMQAFTPVLLTIYPGSSLYNNLERKPIIIRQFHGTWITPVAACVIELTTLQYQIMRTKLEGNLAYMYACSVYLSQLQKNPNAEELTGIGLIIRLASESRHWPKGVEDAIN